MKCIFARKEMSAHLDGEHAGAARERLAGHLQVCETCRAAYAALERTHAMFARAERYPGSPALAWRVAAAIRSGETVRRPFFPTAARRAAQVVALMAVLATGVVSGNLLAAGPAPERAAHPAVLPSLDVFAAASPDSPGGAYLALLEADHE